MFGGFFSTNSWYWSNFSTFRSGLPILFACVVVVARVGGECCGGVGVNGKSISLSADVGWGRLGLCGDQVDVVWGSGSDFSRAPSMLVLAVS